MAIVIAPLAVLGGVLVIGAATGGVIMKIRYDKVIRKRQAEYQRLRLELDRQEAILDDPEALAELRHEADINFVKDVKARVDPLIPELREEKSQHFIYKMVIVVGLVKAGKSSFLNKLFGLHLKVGVDETTFRTEAVHLYRINGPSCNVEIFDMPGKSRKNTLLDAEIITQLHASQILLLYKDEISSSFDLIGCLLELHQNIILCRTHCDDPDCDEEYGIVIARDKEKLTTHFATRYPDSPALWATIYKFSKLRMLDDHRLIEIIRSLH